MPIDVVVSHKHYWLALKGVWAAIPEEHRGVIYAAPEVARIVPGTVALAQGMRLTGTPLVAGHVDLKRIPRGRQVIMMEHGVGQSYAGSPQARRNPAYAGGEGRDSVGLFLCHEEGTLIHDPSLPELEIHPVESHPTAVQRRRGDGLTVTIRGLPNCLAETVTPEHRYWARRIAMRASTKDYKYQYGKPHWIEAQHLDWNTWIGYPIDQTEVLDPPTLAKWDHHQQKFLDEDYPHFLDAEFWWIVGLWWGDGTLGGNRKSVISWAMGDAHPDVKDRLLKLLRKFEWEPREGRFKADSKMSTVWICDSVLGRWLLTWRKGNSRKEPPAWVEQLPLDHQRQLIAGYFAADGTRTKGDETILSSIHLPGLLSVRRMLNRCGEVSSIRAARREAVRYIPVAGTTKLRCGDYTLRLNHSDFLGNPHERKMRKLRQAFIEDGFLWSRVLSVKEVEDKVFVPIQTATESYTTAYGLSHNCPNEYAGARDRARYPHAQVEIIGSPRLAELQRIAHANNPEPVLAVTTHWPCSVAPEAGSGWGHWYKAWGEYAADGHKMIGTAHPRCFRQLARHYVRMGIEPVEDFTEVMRRADVLAFDSTSAGYEWAGTGRPVVVLDVPWWRTPRGHGLRFDDAADIGPRIMNVDAFPAAVDAALAKRPWPGAEERLARVFPAIENPAGRAAEIAVAYALKQAGAATGTLAR